MTTPSEAPPQAMEWTEGGLRSRLLWLCLVYTTAAAGVYTLLIPFWFPGVISRVYLTGFTTLVLLGLIALYRLGHKRPASIGFVLTTWTLITTGTLTGGGMTATGQGLYFFLIACTGLLEPGLMVTLLAVYLLSWLLLISTGHPDGFPMGRVDRSPMSIWTARLIFMSGLAGLIITTGRLMRKAFRDVLRTRSALETLTQQQRVLIDLSNESSDFILYTDPQHRVLFANSALQKFLGLPAGSLPEQAVHIFAPHATDRFLQETLPSVHAGGHWRGETILQDAHGNETPVDQVVLSHRNEAGSITHISMSMRDIRQQKDIQNELQRSNEDLHQFALIASHDLQAPLRKVVTFTQLLLEEHSTHLNEEGRQFARFAADSATHMRDLIRDLLAYSTIDGGEHTPTPVDLASTLNRVRERLMIDIHQHQVVLSWDEHLPTVWAVPQQLYLVMQNIISNAITYVPAGTAPQVHVVAVETADGVEISVQDNGIGIPEDYRDSIFEIFKRLHARHHYPGTGIGLAICRRVLEGHHGWIRAEENPGGGTIFRMFFPHASITKG